jgi:hypothetical protein
MHKKFDRWQTGGYRLELMSGKPDFKQDESRTPVDGRPDPPQREGFFRTRPH